MPMAHQRPVMLSLEPPSSLWTSGSCLLQLSDDGARLRKFGGPSKRPRIWNPRTPMSGFRCVQSSWSEYREQGLNSTFAESVRSVLPSNRQPRARFGGHRQSPLIQSRPRPLGRSPRPILPHLPGFHTRPATIGAFRSEPAQSPEQGSTGTRPPGAARIRGISAHAVDPDKRMGRPGGLVPPG